MEWKIKKYKSSPKLLIHGLPGIGSVGRITVEYLIEKLNAKKIGFLKDSSKPALILVNEENAIEEPLIELYRSKDILIVTGSYQPSSDERSWEYAEKTLKMCKGVKEVITVGGIGLDREVKNPKVYVTGHKSLVSKAVKSGAHKDIYGVVGPIMGAAGTIVVKALEKGIKAITLLGETLNDPLSLGLRASKEVIKILDRMYKLNVDLKEIDKEIKKNEKIMERLIGIKEKGDTTYIG